MIYKARLKHPLPNITYTIGSYFIFTSKGSTTKLLVKQIARCTKLPITSVDDLWTSLKASRQNAHISNTRFSPEAARGHYVYEIGLNIMDTAANKSMKKTIVFRSRAETSGCYPVPSGMSIFA